MNKKKIFAYQLPIAISISLAVLTFRWHMIFENGLQFPILDQWSEYTSIYKPFVEGNLSVRDFFTPHNEHLIPIQKAIHLALFAVLGEWNPMAQMFMNAVFFTVLVFLGSLLAGALMDTAQSIVVQITILACGLMVGPAENFLWGFQTGWYVYYFTSGIVLLGLSNSSKFDIWWGMAFLFSILSCLCLASGVANLFLCMVVPTLRDWVRRIPSKRMLIGFLPYVALCLPLILFFINVAIVARASAPPSIWPSPTTSSLFLNLINIFSYPFGLLPITFFPTLAGLWFVISRPSAGKKVNTGFPFLFALWAIGHAVIIFAGRGSFSGRHTELLLFGIVANVLLMIQPAQFIWQSHSHRLRVLPTFWLAAILGGLAYRAAESRLYPKTFADFYYSSYDLLNKSLVLGDPDVLSSTSWIAGLPIRLLASQPGLLDDPYFRKIAPAFFPAGIRLTPPPRKDLLVESTLVFPTPYPFLPWVQIQRTGDNMEIQKFKAVGISQAFAKIVFAGRWDDPSTGIYENDSTTQRLGLKKAFSQREGWRAVFLPVTNGVIEFNAKVQGKNDWLIFQQPIPCSKIQVYLEFLGRQSHKLWAFFLGMSTFLLLAGSLIVRNRALDQLELADS